MFTKDIKVHLHTTFVLVVDGFSLFLMVLIMKDKEGNCVLMTNCSHN